jgi:hypothetical protein
MILSDRAKKGFFVGMAILSLIAALYHLTGVFYKINNSPVWRHSIFVVIDLFCVYGFLRRPGYFVYFYLVFLIQQYYSHGLHLINLWHLGHKIHWISLAVLIFMPIGFIILLDDSIKNKVKDSDIKH